jgi:hypothetical protein
MFGRTNKTPFEGDERGMTSEEGRRGRYWRSPNVLVPVVGLLYFALLFSILTIQTLLSTGRIEFFELLYLPFVITSIVALVGLWRRSRLGYVAAAAVSALVVVITGAAPKPNDLIDVLSNPASSGEFFSRITFYPALLAVLVYSVLGFRETSRRRLGADERPPTENIPRSSVVALLVLGFILGGLMIGLLAGGNAEQAPRSLRFHRRHHHRSRSRVAFQRAVLLSRELHRQGWHNGIVGQP